MNKTKTNSATPRTPNSPTGFQEINKFTGKFTKQQLIRLSYTDFSQEYEMGPCQAVSLGETSYDTI